MKLRKDRHKFILFLVIILVSQCRNSTVLDPSWSIYLKRNYKLSLLIKEDNLFLIEKNRLYTINQESGKISFVEENTGNIYKEQKTGLTNSTKTKIEHTHFYQDNQFQLIEIFTSKVDCLGYSHRYEIKIQNADSGDLFFLDRNNEYYIYDFEWIKRDLYIIRSLASQPESLVLEKYAL